MNLVAPSRINYRQSRLIERNSRVIVILIEFDQFADRTVKSVNGMHYPCGRSGLNNFSRFCERRNVDFLNVITTDNACGIEYYDGRVNCSIFLKNGGTDIAALASLRTVLGRYTHVIVANSSHNSMDSQEVGYLYDELIRNVGNRHFVIGYNGNSRISPTFPVSFNKYKHIITNVFAAPTSDLLETIEFAKKNILYKKLGGFSNKFFAIRYFEILLSRNALYNGGELILLKNGLRVSSNDVLTRWPLRDSRFY